MHMYPYTSVQKLLYHRNYCDFMLSIVQASYRLLFVARLTVVSTTSVTRRSQTHSRKPSKSTLTHDAVSGDSVAQSSFDHPRWFKSHPDCVWFALEAWSQGSSFTKLLFRRVPRVFGGLNFFQVGGWNFFPKNKRNKALLFLFLGMGVSILWLDFKKVLQGFTVVPE